MMIHKSTGLLMCAALVPRIALRLASAKPPHLPGHSVEHLLATASHCLMYFFMTALPITGVMMGYFGGKGLPFFGYTIPGKESPSADDKKLAGNAFWVHKNSGWFFKYTVPVHAGAAGQHVVRGH